MFSSWRTLYLRCHEFKFHEWEYIVILKPYQSKYLRGQNVRFFYFFFDTCENLSTVYNTFMKRYLDILLILSPIAFLVKKPTQRGLFGSFVPEWALGYRILKGTKFDSDMFFFFWIFFIKINYISWKIENIITHFTKLLI